MFIFKITGTILDILLRTVSAIVATAIVGLLASWELTLLMIPVFPACLAFGTSHFRLVKGQTDANRERLEKSSQVVTESITNIRTVAGLGAEDIFVHKYTSYLAGTFK